MNDRLQELKKQVRDTSNLQNSINEEINKTEQIVAYQEKKKQENEMEMAQLIKSVMGRSEIVAAKERELFKDSIEKFSHRQSVMNQQLITLNDFLSDTTSLKAIYDSKREAMEYDLNNQKEALLKNIDNYRNDIISKEDKIRTLNRQIIDKENEVREVDKKLKDLKFKETLKNTFKDKWLPFSIAGFLIVFISGFFGWSTFTFFSWIVTLIKNSYF